MAGSIVIWLKLAELRLLVGAFIFFQRSAGMKAAAGGGD